MASVSPSSSTTATDTTPPVDDKASDFAQQAKSTPEDQSNDGHVSGSADAGQT